MTSKRSALSQALSGALPTDATPAMPQMKPDKDGFPCLVDSNQATADIAAFNRFNIADGVVPSSAPTAKQLPGSLQVA